MTCFLRCVLCRKTFISRAAYFHPSHTCAVPDPRKGER